MFYLRSGIVKRRSCERGNGWFWEVTIEVPFSNSRVLIVLRNDIVKKFNDTPYPCEIPRDLTFKTQTGISSLTGATEWPAGTHWTRNQPSFSMAAMGVFKQPPYHYKSDPNPRDIHFHHWPPSGIDSLTIRENIVTPGNESMEDSSILRAGYVSLGMSPLGIELIRPLKVRVTY